MREIPARMSPSHHPAMISNTTATSAIRALRREGCSSSGSLMPLLPVALRAEAAPGAAQDRFFTTSDKVRLHYIEAGRGRTVVLVPGWSMPAWIFERQIADLARTYRVIAFDPRGQ